MLYKKSVRSAYIRQDNRKYEKPIYIFWKLIRKLFIKVKFECITNGVIIIIPKYKNYNLIIMKVLLYQIKLYIKYNDINYFIFEKNLKFIEQNFNYENNMNGKFFMKCMLLKIFEYIFKVNKQNINLENVYIFVNKYTTSNINIIKKLVEKFKTVNVITENLKSYKRLEDSLYEEGILITVSNNKRKSAKNAKYIVNIDFEPESFGNYSINAKSIIVNLANQLIYFKDAFQGVLINNFEVSVSQDYNYFIDEFYGNIDRKLFLESYLIFNTVGCYNIEKVIEHYEIEIKSLIGIRGVLQTCEIYNTSC